MSKMTLRYFNLYKLYRVANDVEDLNLVKSSVCTRGLFPFFSTTDSAVLDLHCHVLSSYLWTVSGSNR